MRLTGYEGPAHWQKTRSLSITSGKGGVGKSTLTAHLAFELQRLGKKVLIFDGDLGMGNMDIMFGVRPRFTICDVLRDQIPVAEVICPVTPNISLIAGGSGLSQMQNLSNYDRLLILEKLNSLDLSFDYLLIDTAPGIDNNVLYLNAAAEEILVVLTPEPASLTDAYALIKVLNQEKKIHHFSILCNKVKSDPEGLKVYERLSNVCAQFLYVSLDYKGAIPRDYHLTQATDVQKLVTQTQQNSPAALSIQTVARNVAQMPVETSAKGGIQFFWNHLMGIA